MADPAAKPRRQPTDVEWDLALAQEENGNYKYSVVSLALLMDIRRELRKLNKTLTEASIFVNGKVG